MVQLNRSIHSVSLHRPHGNGYESIVFSAADSLNYSRLEFNGLIKTFMIDRGNPKPRKRMRGGLIPFLSGLPDGLQSVDIEITPANDPTVGKVRLLYDDACKNLIVFPRPAWQQLRTPRTGDARPGGKHRDRALILNPEQMKREREARVLALLRSHWPEDSFRIENHAEGVQIGADFRIISLDTGEVVALADAKSSPELTRAQRRTARELYRKGIPYWMVGDDWRLCYSPSLREIATRFKYSEPKQQASSIAA